MKKKGFKIPAIILIISVLVITVAGAYFFVFNKPTPEEETLVNELQEEVKITKVKISGDKAIVSYNQAMEVENQAELFGTWAYILGVTSQEAPEAQAIIVNCVFKDKQKAKITADRQTVQDFLDEEISATEFLQLITAEAVSKGPEI